MSLGIVTSEPVDQHWMMTWLKTLSNHVIYLKEKNNQYLLDNRTLIHVQYDTLIRYVHKDCISPK